MTDRARLCRVLSGPALVICLLAAACSDDAPAPAAPGDGSTTTTTTTTTTTSTVVPATPTEDVIPPAPEQVLADAVASLGTTYRYDSVVTTAAGQTVAVSGARVGGSSRYSVEAGGATVDVIVVDGAAWIRQDGSDEWLPSGDNPAGDPLAPLAVPISVASDPADPSALLAVYDGTAIGLDTAGPAEIRVVVGDGSVTFESTAGTSTLVTTLTADESLEPILAPTG